MRIPHVIPYQGSKRKLASSILDYINYDIEGVFYEPFAGSAAVTLAAATKQSANKFLISDKYEPLIKLWELIINEPEFAADSYENIWKKQLVNPKEYFVQIRSEFNIDQDPIKFMYLVARCVKNSIRFNRYGEFNQSPDNRRLGMKPEKFRKEAFFASNTLKGKAKVECLDFQKVVDLATSNDFVYMDPPWQGTSDGKDPRYAYLLDLEILIEGLKELNNKNVPFILSFDGVCGDKKYGRDLPEYLNMNKVYLDAGRSSQATLLGRNDVTLEALYLSQALIENNNHLRKSNVQLSLF